MTRSGAGLGWRAVIAGLALVAGSTAARADDVEGTGRGAWLGVSTRGLSDSWREREEYWSAGIMVTEVVPGSPANLAGMEAGDVLVSVDSRTLHNPADLADVVSGMEPGNTVPAIVARAGGRMIKVLDLTPGRAPGAAAPAASAAAAPPTPDAGSTAAAPTSPAAAVPATDSGGAPAATAAGEASASVGVTAAVAAGAHDAAATPPTPADARRAGAVVLGVRCESLTQDEAISLGVPPGEGMMVRGVTSDGPADRAGILPGDLLTWVGNMPVTDLDALDRAVAKATSPVNVVTVRNGVTRHVTAEFDAQAAAAAAAPSAAPAPTVAALAAAATAAPSTVPAAVAAPTAAATAAAAAPAVSADHTGDPDIAALKDEVRTLREEVQKLRAELAAMTKQKP